MSTIGIENLLSLILVKENIRSAFLFQPTSVTTGNTTLLKPESSILREMKRGFPELNHSNTYTNYQGTIISKKNYNGRQNITNEEMGKILGYPCYKGFDTIDRSKRYYTINVIATSVDGKKYCILTNECRNKLKLYKFTRFAEKAKWAFMKEKYRRLLGEENDIQTIEVVVNDEIPTQFIINKLIQEKELTKEEKDKVANILFSLGFSVWLELYFIEDFQYNNPVHRGILLSLLLREVNDPLAPFTPLQNYPEQDVKVDEIMGRFENDLLEVLKKTAIEQPSSFASSSFSSSFSTSLSSPTLSSPTARLSPALSFPSLLSPARLSPLLSPSTSHNGKIEL